MEAKLPGSVSRQDRKSAPIVAQLGLCHGTPDPSQIEIELGANRSCRRFHGSASLLLGPEPENVGQKRKETTEVERKLSMNSLFSHLLAHESLFSFTDCIHWTRIAALADRRENGHITLLNHEGLAGLVRSFALSHPTESTVKSLAGWLTMSPTWSNQSHQGAI
jgi:hypothetical protein